MEKLGNTRLAVAAALLVAAAYGCGKSTLQDGTSDAGGDPCGALGHGTAEEIAATPRANAAMEMLAIALSDGVTADPAIYERVIRDVEAIWAGYPEVSDISYRPISDGKSLILQPDDATAAQIESGDYIPEWDCLNDHYGMESVQVNGTTFVWVLLTLKGRYDLALVAEDYAALPGIESASPDGVIGDGPTICAQIEGETYHYVFDDASGDCPSGCIDHVYTYFTVTAGGTIERVASVTTSSGLPAPEWTNLCRR